MLVKMFQASGAEAAKKLEDQINSWLATPPGDREIVQIDTSVCPLPGGEEGGVHVIVTLVYELD
jgi:hypothetical protein